MEDQRVTIKINFKADTIEHVQGWKKKSKKSTAPSDEITSRKQQPTKRSLRMKLGSNEVEMYLIAKSVKVRLDSKDITNLSSDKNYGETGEFYYNFLNLI